MAGRIGWSSTSDYIGRKPIYMVYLGVGTIMYFLLASFGSASLALFLLVTVVILSFYGGGFATIPAYLKDLFGVAEVGAIHGTPPDGVVVPPGSRARLSSMPSPTTRRPPAAPARTCTRSPCTSWSACWRWASSPTCWSGP